MSEKRVIKATVTIEGEVSMGRYYVPNADMDETRKRLLKAEFLEMDEPRARLPCLRTRSSPSATHSAGSMIRRKALTLRS